MVNTFFQPLLFTATLHHLTLIAWERYVAAQKCMDYKLSSQMAVSKRLWLVPGSLRSSQRLSALLRRWPLWIVAFLRRFLTGWTAAQTVCLLLVAFFYGKVCLGIRNRRISKTSQIDVLMKIKLESKVAKTTVFLPLRLYPFLFQCLFLFCLERFGQAFVLKLHTG